MACAWKYFILCLYLTNAISTLADNQETVVKKDNEEPLAKGFDQETAEPATKKQAESAKSEPEASPESQTESREHANGSICTYCSYCKFCELCDKDCPCTKSRSKPNCHMCKYCKYCHLCSAICETVCLPGGFVDTVSSAIWNSLPTFDSKMKDAVDKDIDSVKDWIKEYL